MRRQRRQDSWVLCSSTCFLLCTILLIVSAELVLSSCSSELSSFLIGSPCEPVVFLAVAFDLLPVRLLCAAMRGVLTTNEESDLSFLRTGNVAGATSGALIFLLFSGNSFALTSWRLWSGLHLIRWSHRLDIYEKISEITGCQPKRSSQRRSRSLKNIRPNGFLLFQFWRLVLKIVFRHPSPHLNSFHVSPFTCNYRMERQGDRCHIKALPRSIDLVGYSTTARATKIMPDTPQMKNWNVDESGYIVTVWMGPTRASWTSFREYSLSMI